MKNIKFLLLLVSFLFIAACEGPTYTFQGSNFDAGAFPIPKQTIQYTECALVPQFSFEEDEAMEIVVECEENTRH